MKLNKLKIFFLSLVFLGLFKTVVVLAQEFSSSDFVDSNPVVSLGGGKSTSTNFQMISGAVDSVVGESSNSNFVSHSGFFYFPSVSTPVLSATAGSLQAALSWTSAVGALGINVGSYSVGQATVSGGPYTFTSVGNVLNNTVTGLTAATTYYFVIRANDSLGDSVVTSTEVSVVPTAATVTATTESGSGGTAIVASPQIVVKSGSGSINFLGKSYPNSQVTLLKDGQLALVATADNNGNFQIYLPEVSFGSYIFVLYSEDDKGNRSNLISLPVEIRDNATTNINGIFIPPTIVINKSEIKIGDDLIISGQSLPNSNIIITIGLKNEIFVSADANGFYSYTFNTSLLKAGSYSIKIKSVLNGEISQYSGSLDFVVGTNNVVVKPEVQQQEVAKMDFSGDGRINFVDFSVMSYWYQRPLTVAAKKMFDLNKDGKVNLVDFSILAYNWTG